ncbi:type II toxin-antitoxin system death-on-curing family toxin [Longispora albida]|uniref:type II toxin-antitoxin system death-on-curing family toxin n=1 Tax=Longispora albida TaxID=203523 RepID=UPI000380DEA2|nr:type II toxin-antitoxin system death-on-curing family toxin [Longispora albida]
MSDVRYLSPRSLLDLAVMLGEPAIRDSGLLESAALRPQASAFGEDAYPDLLTKAAALLHSIVTNHPLVDGNKRLGWVAAKTFLLINGMTARYEGPEEPFELVMAVARGELADVKEIGSRLAELFG